MPNKSQSVLLAGAAIGVAAVIAGFIPALGGCLVCLLYIGAGVVAAWHYADRHQLTIKGGQGLTLGVLAGLVAGVVQTVLNMALQATGLRPDWREEARQAFDRSGMDPGQMEQVMEMFSSPFAYVGMIAIGLIMGIIAGGIGGAIGANVFKREADSSDEDAGAFDSPS